MFTFILLPIFLQNAWAEDPAELPPITVTPVTSGWVRICNGVFCSGFFDAGDLSQALHDEIVASLDDIGLIIPLAVEEFDSDNDTISCGTEGEVRTAHASTSIGANRFNMDRGDVVRIRYQNGQSELFRLTEPFFTLAFVPI